MCFTELIIYNIKMDYNNGLITEFYIIIDEGN